MRQQPRHTPADRNASPPSASFINGVDTARLEGVVRDIKDDPDLAACRFRTVNSWIEGGHNRARIKEFWAAKHNDDSRSQPFFVDMDEPPILAGENRGANPVEVALAALSGCLMTTLVYYAALKNIRVNAAGIEIEGDIDLHGLFGLSKDIRPGYRQIRVAFDLDTDGTPEQEAELIKLAQDHSPVYNTINKPVEIKVMQS